MKTTITYLKMPLVVVTFFCATLLGYANDSPIFISKNEDKIIELTLNNVKPGNLLSIKDKEGIKLYNESIAYSGTIKKEFDLSTLPKGNYTIELDKNMEFTSFPFKVKDKEIVFNDKDSQTVFKPLIKVKEGHLMISQLALDMATLKVQIYRVVETTTSTYELLLSEDIEHTRNIMRVYKLSDFEEGKFKVVFTTNGQRFLNYF